MSADPWAARGDRRKIEEGKKGGKCNTDSNDTRRGWSCQRETYRLGQMERGETHVKEEKRERVMGMNDFQYRNREQICKLISVEGNGRITR